MQHNNTYTKWIDRPTAIKKIIIQSIGKVKYFSRDLHISQQTKIDDSCENIEQYERTP